MKKILIIYASAGDGHKAAAEAVYNAFTEFKRADIEFMIIDSLNYTNRPFKYLYKTGYILLIKYVPNIWGFFYHILDNKFFFMINKPLRRLTNAINTRRLARFLIEERFDAVISTHFLVPEVISHLKRKGLVSLRLINVITDFQPHLFWQCSGVDYYTVAAETTKDMLIRRGIGADKIKVLGIPIHKKFNIPLSKEQARLTLKLHPGKFTVLAMGGGLGVGPIREAVLKLQELDFDCQIIVVCGHNDKLCAGLNLFKSSFKKPTYIFGFCRNMHELMSASDIMVSKVGGLTLAETLVKFLPLVAINPVPGQEMRNAAFLFDNNIGFMAKGVGDINRIINEFYYNPQRAAQIRRDMQVLSRPNSAEDIANLALRVM